MGFVLCLSTQGQDQSSPGDAARRAKAAKSDQPKKAAKVITNDNLGAQAACTETAQAPKGVETKDADVAAFLSRIAGRWNSAYFRKGNQSWWPGHGTARPKNETHYLFGSKELLIESRPEVGLPSVTGRFVYGSVRRISEDLFDVALYKPCDPAREEIKRFKLSSDGKTLEMAADAEENAVPTVQVLELVDANWNEVAKPR